MGERLLNSYGYGRRVEVEDVDLGAVSQFLREAYSLHGSLSLDHLERAANLGKSMLDLMAGAGIPVRFQVAKEETNNQSDNNHIIRGLVKALEVIGDTASEKATLVASVVRDEEKGLVSHQVFIAQTGKDEPSDGKITQGWGEPDTKK